MSDKLKPYEQRYWKLWINDFNLFDDLELNEIGLLIKAVIYRITENEEMDLSDHDRVVRQTYNFLINRLNIDEAQYEDHREKQSIKGKKSAEKRRAQAKIAESQPAYYVDYVQYINNSPTEEEFEILDSWAEKGIEEALISELINRTVKNNKKTIKDLESLVNICISRNINTLEQLNRSINN
ncbi:MAG: DnaD domain protein [Saccharofermentanales bacterium]